ncbi:MAG: MerR family transcriptional regulator [Armatimonadota bacterium]|nr:MAG: MerR family transcriptional regulator [Armatimonadota bacterium]
MADTSHEWARTSVRPVDFSKLLERLELGIGQAARLCGVSIRQLSYWTDKGIVNPIARGSSRTYDYPAIIKVCLIKQGLDQGYSLEGAVAEAEAFLERREQHQLAAMPESELRKLLLTRGDRVREFAGRIRRGLRTYRVSGDLGRLVASVSGLEKLIAFLEANPYIVNTARQIALRVGREADAVQRELDLLEQRRFVQKITYPGADVYRYLPPRRR